MLGSYSTTIMVTRIFRSSPNIVRLFGETHRGTHRTNHHQKFCMYITIWNTKLVHFNYLYTY